MSTNNIVVNSGESAGLFLSLATHIFENHGKEIGDSVIGKNFALSYMREKAKEKTSGGLDFAQPTMIGESSNFGFVGKYAQIPAAIQDPTREFKFDPIPLTGTVVINKVHELQNKGDAQIKKWGKTLTMQAETSVQNIMNRALWAGSPVANVEPESIRSIVSDTPTTGTIGTISRVGNVWAQNKVNGATIASIGSAAGVAALHKFRAILGGSAKVSPDFALTTATLWGNLLGFMDAGARRVTSSEQMTKLGFENFFIGSALLGYDGDGGTGECPNNHFYYLNSKHLFFQVLEGGDMVFEPFSYKDNSLNATSVFYMIYNITTNQPNALGVFSAITG